MPKDGFQCPQRVGVVGDLVKKPPYSFNWLKFNISHGIIIAMHIRFSHCRGLPVVEEQSQQPVGTIEDIFIHPDMGKAEGFFVRIRHFLHSETLFLGTADIAHWGRTVMIRDRDVLAPLEDHVRLQQLFDEGRTVLGQKMVTESGKALGTCGDVQIETHTFRAEWFFPRTLFGWGRPVPVTSVMEVRPDAIVVREQSLTQEVKAEDAVFAPLDPLKQTPLSRRAD